MLTQGQHGFQGLTHLAPWFDQKDFPPSMKKSTAAGVLVVDDEALVRWSLAETLQARGYDVLEAGDGAAAIEALSAESGRIDVVLLDLRLPDCDDLHVLSEVRQIAPGASI